MVDWPIHLLEIVEVNSAWFSAIVVALSSCLRGDLRPNVFKWLGLESTVSCSDPMLRHFSIRLMGSAMSFVEIAHQ
jgi:hypothetical protein